MPTTDITKKYRISSQLAGLIASAVDIESVETDICFKSKSSELSLRLAPITLDLKEKTITIIMLAGENVGTLNFGMVPSDWFEYIEATFALIINKYLNKNLS